MEVRCGRCNKLFRVADEKITGSGIKFPCSKCGETVKITREELEQQALSQQTAPRPLPPAVETAAPKSGAGSMEVRCEKCSKLFRVAEDKITGIGIKFSCSRCGEYVKITRQDFENYTLSRSAVSALDLFEPKPKAVPAPVAEEITAQPSPETAPAEVSPSFDLAEQAVEPERDEEQPAVLTEPVSAEEPVSPPESELSADIGPTAPEAAAPQYAEETPPLTASEPAAEEAPAPVPETAAVSEPAQSMIEREPKPEPAPEKMPEPPPEVKPAAAEQRPDVQSGAGREWKPPVVSEPEPVPAAARQPAAAVPPATPRRTPVRPAAAPVAAQKRETVPSAATRSAERIVTGAISASRPSGSGTKVIVALSVLIAIGLGITGYVVMFRPKPPQEQSKSGQLVTAEGLQISALDHSLDASGDLLVTGVITNSEERERTAWYVVVEIYDAQGNLLGKLRCLNGNQILSRREIDILAGRGMNVQELQTKLLLRQGTVIAPRGSVNFAVRFVQPPAGIASFNAMLHPFDPEKMQQEIAAGLK